MRSIIATICCFLIFNCAEGPLKKRFEQVATLGWIHNEVHPERRIYKGFKANEGQFPYVVLVGVALGDKVIMCGGSILNEMTILTVAHCVCNAAYKKEQMLVRYGSNQWISGGNVDQVDKIECHPKYTNILLAVHDIALVKLKNPLKYSKNIKAVKLPTSNVAEDRKDLIFAGWGENTSQLVPYDLHFINLYNIVNLKTCEERARVYNITIGRYVLCAKPLGQGYGVCRGDSGGPLMDNNGTQYGIAKKIIGVCADSEPDIFTNVFYYKDWIEEKMFY